MKLERETDGKQPRAASQSILNVAEARVRNFKGEIESPSDIDGIVYVRMDEGGAMTRLTQEMESAGFL